MSQIGLRQEKESRPLWNKEGGREGERWGGGWLRKHLWVLLEHGGRLLGARARSGLPVLTIALESKKKFKSSKNVPFQTLPSLGTECFWHCYPGRGTRALIKTPSSIGLLWEAHEGGTIWEVVEGPEWKRHWSVSHQWELNQAEVPLCVPLKLMGDGQELGSSF